MTAAEDLLLAEARAAMPDYDLQTLPGRLIGVAPGVPSWQSLARWREHKDLSDPAVRARIIYVARRNQGLESAD